MALKPLGFGNYHIAKGWPPDGGMVWRGAAERDGSVVSQFEFGPSTVDRSRSVAKPAMLSDRHRASETWAPNLGRN